jgi:hypothetical protein
MIKGINGNPYLNMEQYLDMDTFEEMQPEIIRGFAEAREFAKEGTWMKPGFTFDDMSYKLNWKPIYQSMDEFMELPKDDPIYQAGVKLMPTDFKNFAIAAKIGAAEAAKAAGAKPIIEGFCS